MLMYMYLSMYLDRIDTSSNVEFLWDLIYTAGYISLHLLHMTNTTAKKV